MVLNILLFQRSLTSRSSFYRNVLNQYKKQKNNFPFSQTFQNTKTFKTSTYSKSKFQIIRELIPTYKQWKYYYKDVFISFVLRTMTVCGILHLLDTYFFVITGCEGSSMLPTMQTSGELILVERISHRMFGIKDGDTSEERINRGKILQQQFQEEMEKKNNKENKKLIWHQSQKSKLNIPLWKKAWNKFTTGIQHGDVIMAQRIDKNYTITKRVIGLPGDTIILKKPYRHSKLIVVPDGHVWIEGDNPLTSVDSREYGPIPACLLIGKVIMKIWPLHNKTWLESERPIPPQGGRFLGSTVIPAGYQGEEVIH